MTLKRIAFLQELLDFIGLEGRLHLEWISSAEAQKFVRIVTRFTEKVRNLGPNPLSRWERSIPFTFQETSRERIEGRVYGS